ncbi:30S ribosomal protein S6 [Flavilitoribacter nigricans]|uniref:Small ribosomal subunit protein bS6 n=1 Tax=Flavilitoribacter nigricans (strain ATCC 23147 / DSM 23189 / NBRC 102662 / NCIMB 1420 / SS-2) TaxID=1122177 RepID=A0A2D0MYC4_FLAN2|nr:30S ribosomal protein S6 [Flavilitoribacter nigricans]PHN00879.1 30S ribosomal protein S6 [Flavilitoribacter nigricans DSM 23189 = NBRC 102662]
MKSYEITFIVDPVLSGDEIKATAQTYVDQLKEVGATIVHVDEMGLRQLAYPINKRSSGVYYTVEFTIEDGTPIDKLELSLRRDERIMRFLTVRLDKYGVKYNEDKRKGLIGKVKKKSKKGSQDKDRRDRNDRNDRGDRGGKSGGNNRNRSESKPKPKTESKAATATAEEEE